MLRETQVLGPRSPVREYACTEQSQDRLSEGFRQCEQPARGTCSARNGAEHEQSHPVPSSWSRIEEAERIRRLWLCCGTAIVLYIGKGRKSPFLSISFLDTVQTLVKKSLLPTTTQPDVLQGIKGIPEASCLRSELVDDM